MDRDRVLVVGAGIAGLATAAACSDATFRCASWNRHAHAHEVVWA